MNVIPEDVRDDVVQRSVHLLSARDPSVAESIHVTRSWVDREGEADRWWSKREERAT